MRLMVGLPVLLLCWASLALGSPVRTITQYRHHRFTSDDGAPAIVSAIAQSRDGYIWLATPEGMVRFDGLAFEPIASPLSKPGTPAGPLLATRSGDLWVGRSALGRIEIFRGARVIDAKVPNADLGLAFIREDLDGAIWVGVGGFQNPLRRWKDGRWQEIGSNWGLPKGIVFDLLTARDGTVWVTTGDAVAFLRRGAGRFEITPARVLPGAGLAEDAAGNIWISDKSGSRELPAYPRGATTASSRAIYPSAGGRLARLAFDREGALWGISETNGIVRIAGLNDRPGPGAGKGGQARVERYAAADGLTSTQANGLLRDREGNLWVATDGGLDRFQATNIVADTRIPKGTPEGYGLMADARGYVYIADSDTLYAVRPGGEPEVMLRSIVPEVFCPASDGAIWLVANGTMLRLRDGKLIARVPVKGGLGTYGCAEDRAGRVWTAMFKTGALQWHDRSGWHDYSLPAGLPGKPVDVVIDVDGRAIVRLERKGLFRVEPGGARTLPLAQLGVGGLLNMFAGRSGLLVLGPDGLARIGKTGISRLSVADYPWLLGLRDIDQSRTGTTWILNPKGVARIATRDLDAAFQRPGRRIPIVLLGRQDGFISRPQSSQGAQMADGGDGRLWVLTRQAVLHLDPAQIVRNPLPPPVVIQAVVAGARRYADRRSVTLPKGVTGLSIDFAVPSLVAPRQLQVRYRLEGFDDHWIDAGIRRQASYTNLRPGAFRFHVIAANESGVWNRQGASVVVQIPPTFVQTRTFFVLCVLAVGLAAWVLYSLRLRVVGRRIRVRMTDLLQERERIARELHDTLLQGVFALFLHFQAITDQIADENDRIESEKALDRAQAVIAEGRDRVVQLRAAETGDLREVLTVAAKAVGFPSSTTVDVIVAGQWRAINPWVSDEATRIATEALFNARQHAQATAVAVRIAFGPRAVTITVRDNGIGIDPIFLRRGRQNHFGLTGMRERARRIHGDLQIRAAQGTVVELRIPSRTAYPREPAARSWWRWWSRRTA